MEQADSRHEVNVHVRCSRFLQQQSDQGYEDEDDGEYYEEDDGQPKEKNKSKKLFGKIKKLGRKK